MFFRKMVIKVLLTASTATGNGNCFEKSPMSAGAADTSEVRVSHGREENIQIKGTAQDYQCRIRSPSISGIDPIMDHQTHHGLNP